MISSSVTRNSRHSAYTHGHVSHFSSTLPTRARMMNVGFEPTPLLPRSSPSQTNSSSSSPSPTTLRVRRGRSPLSIPLPSIEGPESIMVESDFLEDVDVLLEDIDVILDGTSAPPPTPSSAVVPTATNARNFPEGDPIDLYHSTTKVEPSIGRRCPAGEEEDEQRSDQRGRDSILDDSKNVDGNNKSSALTELQKRLEKYLEEELNSAYGRQTPIASPTPVQANNTYYDAGTSEENQKSFDKLDEIDKRLTKNNGSQKGRWNWARKLFKKSSQTKDVSMKKEHNDKSPRKKAPPVVWVIQPFYKDHNDGDEQNNGIDSNDEITFKFTADTGVCLNLKESQAFSCIEIMKKYTRKLNCNTFFQLYAVNSRESRVVQADGISEIMFEMYQNFFDGPRASASTLVGSDDQSIGPSMIVSGELEGTSVSYAQIENSPLVKQIKCSEETPRSHQRIKNDQHSPGNDYSGLLGYLMRRRWKNMIKQQMKTAMGAENNFRKKKDSKAWRFLYPFWVVWKAIRRPGRI